MNTRNLPLRKGLINSDVISWEFLEIVVFLS